MGPASSLKSRRNAIVVPARPPKRTPNSSSLVMPLWSPWSHPSPCASSPSLTSPHWVASPYVTCVKPSLSVGSNPSTSRMPPLERSPRPPKRLPRRSELWSWENYLRLNIHQNATPIFNRTIFVGLDPTSLFPSERVPQESKSFLPRFLEIMSVMWPLLSGCVFFLVYKTRDTVLCSER